MEETAEQADSAVARAVSQPPVSAVMSADGKTAELADSAVASAVSQPHVSAVMSADGRDSRAGRLRRGQSCEPASCLCCNVGWHYSRDSRGWLDSAVATSGVEPASAVSAVMSAGMVETAEQADSAVAQSC